MSKLNLHFNMLVALRRRVAVLVGRPLTTKENRSLVSDVAKVAERILEQEPWQEVVSVTKSQTGGWWINTPLVAAKWENDVIPGQPSRAYLKRDGDNYVARGILDTQGFVHSTA